MSLEEIYNLERRVNRTKSPLASARSLAASLSHVLRDRMPSPHEQNLEVERRRTQDAWIALGILRDALLELIRQLENFGIDQEQIVQIFEEHEEDPYWPIEDDRDFYSFMSGLSNTLSKMTHDLRELQALARFESPVLAQIGFDLNDLFLQTRRALESGGGSGVTDHGALTGLGDDDHVQYTKADGTRAFTGAQSMGSSKLTNLASGTVSTDAVNKGQMDNADALLIAKAVVTTKGDIIVRDATVPVRKAVGANNRVLSADSATSDGLDWKTIQAVLAALLTTKGDLIGRSGSVVDRLAVGATDGQALVVETAATLGLSYKQVAGTLDWLFTGTTPFDLWFDGSISSATPTTRTAPLNFLELYPVFVPRAAAINAIRMEVTTESAAGGKVRIGIYDATSKTNPSPNALLADSGEMATDTVGLKEAAISVALTGPSLLWFAAVFGSQAPVVRSHKPEQILPILGSENADGSIKVTGVRRSFTYGALPNPVGGTLVTRTTALTSIGVQFA